MVPGLVFVCNHVGRVDSHGSQSGWLVFEQVHVKKDKVTEHLRDHGLLLVEVGNHLISFHESKDTWPHHVEVKLLENIELTVDYLITSYCVVDNLKNSLELRWIDLFILPSDMQSRYPETLELRLLVIFPAHQNFVNYANGDIQSFRPHLKFIVQLCQPINKVLSVLL